MTNRKSPILVTGPHRSGSTWVGQMIAKSPSVGYIHEPFSINPNAGICAGYFKHWFTYICDDNATDYVNHIRQCLNYRCSVTKSVRAQTNLKGSYHVICEWLQNTRKRVQKKRPLIKDPLALYSSEWLARTFDMAVIVLIRHPAAFAGSLKHSGWSHPFDHFLEQPLLMRDHLASFSAEIKDFTAKERDIVDQAILLWNLTHTAITNLRQRHSEWFFVRHEDVATNPLGVFGEILQYLDLDYQESVKSAIVTHSTPQSENISEDLLSIKRDSKTTVSSWRKRLSEGEIQRVKLGTERLYREFYGEEDW